MHCAIYNLQCDFSGNRAEESMASDSETLTTGKKPKVGRYLEALERSEIDAVIEK